MKKFAMLLIVALAATTFTAPAPAEAGPLKFVGRVVKAAVTLPGRAIKARRARRGRGC